METSGDVTHLDRFAPYETAGLCTEQTWTFGSREHCLSPTHQESVFRPAHSVVRVPTTISVLVHNPFKNGEIVNPARTVPPFRNVGVGIILKGRKRRYE